MKVCIIAEAYRHKLLPISFELLTRALALAPGDIGAIVVSDGLADSELQRLVAAGADTVLSYEGGFLLYIDLSLKSKYNWTKAKS